jgi:hypothetical protein
MTLQHTSILIDSELFGLDNFRLQVFEVLLIQVKAALQGSVRHSPITPKQFQHLGQGLIKRHTSPSALAYHIENVHTVRGLQSLFKADITEGG